MYSSSIKVKSNRMVKSKTLLLCMVFLFFSQMMSSAQITASLFTPSTTDQRAIVSVDFEKVPLAEALRTLARKVNVGISYKTVIVPPKRVTYRAENTSIFKILDDILKDTGLQSTLSQDRKVIMIKKKPVVAAQKQEKVTGTVTDAGTGQTLPGVNIAVKGTTTGTSTGANGRYELTVESLQDTLAFTFIGYKAQKVPISGRTTIDVALSTTVSNLEEMVVVGYGSETKKSISGSVSEISGVDIENTTENSFQQTLQGQISGVHITSNSSQLGEGINVQIRGSASITAGNQPLYVLDGVPVKSESINSIGQAQTNPLATLNKNDIKSISVLKDASAAAIYGSRASNGVVIIETKDGQAGETQFSATYQISSSSPTNKLDLMDAQQFINFFRRAAIGGGKYDYRINPDAWLNEDEAINFYLDDYTSRMEGLSLGSDWQNNPRSFNWQNKAFQGGYSQGFHFSANGGNEQTTFFAGGGYSDKEGIMASNAFKKIDGRLNIEHHASDKIDLGFRIGISRDIINKLMPTNGNYSPLINVVQPPISPFFEDDNSDQPGYQEGPNYNNNTVFLNTIEVLKKHEFKDRIFQTLGNVNAEYEIIPNLSFKTRFGMDLINQNEERYLPPSISYFNGEHGYGHNVWSQIQNYTNDNLLTYKSTFASKHDLKVILGESYNWVMQTSTSVEGENYPSQNFTNLANSASITSGSNTDTDYRFISYFTRANYSYKDRYLFKVSARIDGSSRFGKNHRYGLFPAVSAGWTLSDETFLKDMENLRLLKLRASYGITGNANIGNFKSLSLYDGVSYAGAPALAPSQTPNPDLKWEKTKQFDIGVDFGFFNQRIDGSIDYYYKKTNDLLINTNIPATSGFNSQLRNVGQLENSGVEFHVSTRNLTGSFSWRSNFNISFNHNKVTNLNGQIIKVETYSNRYVNHAIEDEPLGVFYTIEYAGVNPKNGDALYYVNHKPTDTEMNKGGAFKVNGMFNNRYVTNNSDIASSKVVGNPNPDFTGGFKNTFSYKGVNLDVLWQFVYGNEVYNATYFLRGRGLSYTNNTVKQLNAWQKPGDITDIPQARLKFDNGVTTKSSQKLSDGSYLRLKNVTLAYNFPQTFLSKLKLRQIKLFLTGTNLLTFTKYDGYDPEHGLNFGQSNLNIGNAFFTPPQARTISAGIKINF